MGSPSDDAPERVDLGKHADQDGQPSEQAAEAPFDPYRFGAPDVPPPPEYAPPGYTPPPGYQYPPAAEDPHGAYPPYPYGTTAGSQGGYPSAPPGQAPYGPGPHGQPPYGQSPYGQSPYGQAPYGQGPYGQAPYGPGAHGTAGSGGTGKAVTGLVFGILSIVLCWTTFLDAIFVLLAVIFGSLGLGDARRSGRGRGQALAGLICAGVGAALAVLFTVLVVHLANKCGGLDNQGSAGYNRCLRDQLS